MANICIPEDCGKHNKFAVMFCIIVQCVQYFKFNTTSNILFNYSLHSDFCFPFSVFFSKASSITSVLILAILIAIVLF